MIFKNMSSSADSVNYDLDAESIDKVSEWIDRNLSDKKIPQSDVLRLRLSAEEILGIWSNALGADTQCLCVCTRKMGRRLVVLKCPGKMVNPCEAETTGIQVSDTPNIISALGMMTEYSYHGGYNILQIAQPPKKNKISAMPVAIFSAIVLGLFLRLVMPGAGGYLDAAVINPIFETLMRLLTLVSGPMVFLSLVCGIIGIGNPQALGRIGKKLLSLFGLQYLGIIILALIMSLPFYSIVMNGSSGNSGAAGQIRDLLLSVIPSNIIDPFQTGNATQIIFLAVIAGISLLALEDTVSTLSEAVRQLNLTVQLIMNNVGKLMPFFIFVSLMNLILTGDVTYITYLIIPIILTSAACIIWVLINAGYISMKYHVPLPEFFKDIMPTFIISFTTASSAAAFRTAVDCCKNKFGMKESNINFGVTLGQVLFTTGAAASYLFMTFSMAQAFSVSLTPAWMITSAIVSILLAAATPPIPGGALSSAAILFTQLGIPDEGLAMAISYLLITDYIATGECMVNLLETLYIASRNE